MIGLISGRVVGPARGGEVVVDVGGVGYRVSVGATAVASGSYRAGQQVTLYTHLQVREDSLTLYGFATLSERDCFEALIGAHGVGPSLAMAILDIHDPPTLARVVGEGDLDSLVLVPGVGRKTAARLLIELRSRLDLSAEAPVHGPGSAALNGNGQGPSARSELRAALEQLGYGPEEIAATLTRVPAEGDVAGLLKEALRIIGKARVS